MKRHAGAAALDPVQRRRRTRAYVETGLANADPGLTASRDDLFAWALDGLLASPTFD